MCPSHSVCFIVYHHHYPFFSRCEPAPCGHRMGASGGPTPDHPTHLILTTTALIFDLITKYDRIKVSIVRSPGLCQMFAHCCNADDAVPVVDEEIVASPWRVLSESRSANTAVLHTVDADNEVVNPGVPAAEGALFTTTRGAKVRASTAAIARGARLQCDVGIIGCDSIRFLPRRLGIPTLWWIFAVTTVYLNYRNWHCHLPLVADHDIPLGVGIGAGGPATGGPAHLRTRTKTHASVRA